MTPPLQTARQSGRPSDAQRPSTGSIGWTPPSDPRRLRQLRQWLEYVAATAIEMLDDLDAQEVELEDDELGNDDSVEALRA